MIEEADFQKIGNAAIDLCVFVEKLRLGKKHRAEANKLTHNVLNLIKRAGKIEEKEPLTKGNDMSKKLKIQFWKAEKALAMQILEQEGLPKEFTGLNVNIIDVPFSRIDWIGVRGSWTNKDNDVAIRLLSTNVARDAYLQKVVNAITEELFSGKGELKVGEMCEVKDDEDDNWEKKKLIAILPEQYDERFIVEAEDYPTLHSSWDCARPIAKRTEPIVKECGNVVTYTWKEK